MSLRNSLLSVLSYWLAVQRIYSIEISQYIHCYDWPGNIPTGQGSSQSSYAECTFPYSLTSCGVQTYPKNSADTQLESVYKPKSDTTCYANTPDAIPNQAIARCCNLTDYGSSFSVVFSSKSTDIATKPCLVNEEAIGCMIGASNSAFYGAYAGSLIDYDQINTSDIFDTANSCSAEGGSLWAYSMCYDTSTITDGFELNCISRWGPRSNETGTTTSTVSCPNDKENYFMTSCTGYSPFSDVKSYTVINDVCTVTERVDPNAVYVIANAICCRMTKSAGTLNPSYQTDSPTVYPTLIPTDSTVDPTKQPTKYPTSFPTKQPTKHPTSFPTKYLTADPTLAPSFNPSSNPLSNPTFNPSSNPIFNPTLNPTFNPTMDPVKDARVNADTTQSISVEESPENAASTENGINKVLVIALLIVSTVLILVVFVTIFVWGYKKMDDPQIQLAKNVSTDQTQTQTNQTQPPMNQTNTTTPVSLVDPVVATTDKKQSGEPHVDQSDTSDDTEDDEDDLWDNTVVNQTDETPGQTKK